MRNHDRRGFTLIELLLVLALIAAIASITLPNVMILLSDSRVKRAGDEIRIVLAEARLEAMRSGRTQMFRCELGSGKYSVQPWNDASDMTEAADMTGQTALGSAGTTGGGSVYTPPEPKPADVKQLPENVVFSGEQVESTQRGMLILQQVQLQQSDEGWAQPIILYADGTTSTAIVQVKAEDGSVVKVHLRGLTGESTVSEVTTDAT